MARAQFGGSQDNSSLFASYYNAWESHQQDLVNRAENRAINDQNSTDNEWINRWQNGEITDSEFLAYAQQRVKDPNNTSDQTASWQKTISTVNASIKQHKVEDGARSIMTGIQNGTKSYGDLLSFYQSSLKGLNRNDPLYESILGQIDSVRQNMASAARSAANTRKAAAVAGIKSQIDSLDGTLNLIEAVSDQFNKGDSVASVQMIDANGNLVNRSFTIRDANGNPTADMAALDHQYLDTIDAEMKAQVDLAKVGGDSTVSKALGALAQKRADWIVNQIQPRNTIAAEGQANQLLSGLNEAVARAANSTDPATAWANVASIASTIQAWDQNLNTQLVKAKVALQGRSARTPEGIATAPDRTVTATVSQAAAPENQTTADFSAKAKAIADLANLLGQIGSPGNSTVDVSQQVQQLITAIYGNTTDPLKTTQTQAGNLFMAAIATVQGQNNGSYQFVYVQPQGGDPLSGFAWLPTVTKTTFAPDGTPLYSRTPVSPKDGKALVGQNQMLLPGAVDLNGQTVSVGLVATKAAINPANGQLVSDANPLQQGVTADAAWVAALPDPTSGDVHYWFKTNSGWYRDSVQGAKALPMPYSGSNLREAQRIANTTPDPTTGQALDQTGTAFISGEVRDTFDNQGWYQRVQDNARQEQSQKLQQDRANQMASQWTAAGQAKKGIGMAVPPDIAAPSSDLTNLAQSLNIKTAADIGNQQTPSQQQQATQLATARGFQKTARMDLPPIQLKPIDLPTITPVSLNLPTINPVSVNVPSISSPSIPLIRAPQTSKFAGKALPL